MTETLVLGSAGGQGVHGLLIGGPKLPLPADSLDRGGQVSSIGGFPSALWEDQSIDLGVQISK